MGGCSAGRRSSREWRARSFLRISPDLPVGKDFSLAALFEPEFLSAFWPFLYFVLSLALWADQSLPIASNGS